MNSATLLFRGDIVLPHHPNGMRFTAFDSEGAILRQEIYYSVGGGFIEREGQPPAAGSDAVRRPYPFSSAAEMLAQGDAASLPIWAMMLENEKALRGEAAIRERVARIWTVMQECTLRGITTDGLLPGGLDVRRRAPELHRKLLAASDNDPLRTIDWINLYAIAVNEENAAGGRVATAPTNGAAGVIPAVAHYYKHFAGSPSDEGIPLLPGSGRHRDSVQGKRFHLGRRGRMPGRSRGGVLHGGRRPGGRAEWVE